MFNARLRPSRFLSVWIVLWTIAVATVIWFSALPWWLCLIVDCGVVFWSLGAWRCQRQLANQQLSYHEGRWTLRELERSLPLILTGEFYLSPWLVALTFTGESGKKRKLVLARDSIDRDDFRRLRVLLKYLPMTDVVI